MIIQKISFKRKNFSDMKNHSQICGIYFNQYEYNAFSYPLVFKVV